MKKYKIIYSPRFLSFITRFAPIDAELVTISPFIFTKSKPVDQLCENHEAIHICQQQELSLLATFLLLPVSTLITLKFSILLLILAWMPLTNPFFCLYLIFYLFNVVKFKDTNIAYSMIPFEQESYDNEKQLVYLKARFSFSWLRYLI